MNKQVSPFAELTAMEKQIRWLEYQSIKLPYVEGNLDNCPSETSTEQHTASINGRQTALSPTALNQARPQPPPEVPRTFPNETRIRHSQYDAVIARLKQAELQSRRSVSQTMQQIQ